MDVRGDSLVIGRGIAGLRAVLTLAEAGDVVVLTKADATESNTGYAQGGIVAALGADDSPELHARDTLAAGDIVTVGLVIARAALRRQESRGGHFRSDFPSRDDIHWKRHVADVFTRA